MKMEFIRLYLLSLKLLIITFLFSFSLLFFIQNKFISTFALSAFNIYSFYMVLSVSFLFYPSYSLAPSIPTIRLHGIYL